MIVILRALARLFRAVLRRSVVEQQPRGEWPLLLCQAGPQGLRLSAQRSDVAVCYHESGARPADALLFRSSVREPFEGRTSDAVTLEQLANGKGRAGWDDAGGPRVFDFETVTTDSAPTLPEPPSTWTTLPEGFLMALDEATRTTAKELGRFALQRVQLRGRSSQVSATDGRQLLLQGGFRFPWTDDILIPRVPAFGLREVSAESPVAIGRTESHVAVRCGRWTFWLTIDTSSRFPDVQTVVPKPAAVTCRLFLDPADAAFLVQTLPKLPGQDDEHAPITLDLDRQAIVRARAQGGSVVSEVVLSRSRVEGNRTRLCLDRSNLRRALQLGFAEICLSQPDKPVLCRDRQRVYIFMPLDKENALAPVSDAVCLASSASNQHQKPPTERRTKAMPAPHPNGDPPNGSQRNGAVPLEDCPTIHELITEAEELRGSLQSVGVRLSRLIAGLKQHKRQSLAMRAAVQSLRQLKLDG